MDRRDVLKLGAVAGVGGSGCATLLSQAGSIGPGELDGFLSSLDAARDAIATGQFFDRLLPSERSPEVAERARHGEELTKKTLRSLLLVGTLRELSPEHLAHEGVQQRLRDSMGEFDDAMFGMTSMLEGLSPTERADISTALRDDPQLGMRVMGAVDEQAAAFGVSMEQRTRLRAVSSHTCSRLRLSPELTMMEYTGKMRKVEAHHGARRETERALAASVGTAMLFQGQTGPVGGEFDAGVLSVPPPPPQVEPERADVPTPSVKPVTQPARKPNKTSIDVLTAGGIALGLTVVFVGLGFAGGGVLGAVSITIGALIGITGIICLIVGLVMLAAGK